MTLSRLYLCGKKILEKGGVENAAFDAMSLFQMEFGLDRRGLAVHGLAEADPARGAHFLAHTRERARGRPLQYILGEWPFLDFTLRVGEGVLIPREETELLVRTAAGALSGAGDAPQIVDLCGGSGAVAIGLASLLPHAAVCCVEWHGDAWRYLQENVERAGLKNLRAERLDVLDPESARRFQALDAIVSNPPYIETGALGSLQREVGREPAEALDGGEDGLTFYRAIASHWAPRLSPGGVLAVEIGETQAAAVCALFASAGLQSPRVLQDFNGLDRVVIGTR